MKKITYPPSSINFLLYMQLFVVQARKMVNYTKKEDYHSLPPIGNAEKVIVIPSE
ncbi:hypothetical protein FHR92_000130 [Fontibacillus solani]|uniref:Uncharacterized protein n=1 Tax=Fontibacillus solani TaxID=1572857 RepID=A0A7W3XPM3_9BACL|nr:hypothetical protein [Fontibacillus solani]MBA9083687.1 hypothetical protein [Fontibacillus solani]